MTIPNQGGFQIGKAKRVDGEIQVVANSGAWKASYSISVQTRLLHISSNLFFFSKLLFNFALSPSRNRTDEEQNKDRIKKKY